MYKKLIAEKTRNAFVQMQWRGWPPKTCPSHVSPCRNWSFSVKRCRHKYGKPPKLRSPRTPLSWGARRGWHAPPATTCYHVKLGSSVTKGVCINRKEPPKLGSAGTPSGCYGTLIGSYKRSIEWWHFQWPWRTPNPVFKVTAYLKSNISKTLLTDKVTIAH